MKLRLHGFLPHSHANGPGIRAVVWVQGCSLGCPGCFNPETHSFEGGEVVTVDDLFQRMVALGDSLEGLTISGGEPLQQRAAVTEFLRRVKTRMELSVIVFTGFTWEEVMRMGATEYRCKGVSEGRSSGATQREIQARRHPGTPTPRYPDLPSADFLNYVDVLIAGRYDRQQHVARSLRGSANKTVHFITDRYTAEDLESVPHAEVFISPHGELILSGIQPVAWAPGGDSA